MKKILNILFLMVMTVALSAQTTLTFVGKDRTGNDYVQLSRVSVFDLDQLWHQEIFYPDTTLVLYVNGTVGVETFHETSLQMQNNPNPFDGTTDVVLSTPYDGDVTMEIADVNGHIVGTHSVRPQPGTHQFRLTLSAPGTYVLTARQNGRTVSVKMVNAGNGGGDGIEYVGSVETMCTSSLQLKSGTRGDGNYPFHNGDVMRYTGYAVVDDVEIESETVGKAQNGNETIPLKFDVARPEVVTNAASNIAASAATLNGEVTDDNNANVTERGFCYGTGNNPSLNGTHVAVNSGMGTFSAPVNSLTPATNYNVRAYATNMVGTSYGLQKTFRTMDTLPVVTTTEPSNFTATTFTSGGDVLVLNSNSLTARGICWNTTGAPTIADSHTTQSGGLGSFTSNITDLDCGTIYYVRAYATNSVGTAYGEEYSVTTTQEMARVVTGNVSNITDNSAVCVGEVSYDGCSEVTARGVCWSTEQNPTIADSHTTDGSGLGDFTSNLTELDYATTYYIRAYATNDVGTAYGEELNFTTQPILPTVTTADATNITATSFICGGDVTNDGGAEVTARGICWSTNPNPITADNHTTDGDGTGTFTSNVNELSCSTTYYVRAYATNSVGTAYGEVYSVTTTDTLPEIELLTAQVYATSIAVHSEVLAENCAAVTARGVCWNTTGSPTIVDSHTTNGNGLGNYTSTISGLIPNTTYYVRTYATNRAGTEYGQVYTYHTMDTLPVVTTTVPFDVTHTDFTSGGEVTAMNSSSLTACGICWNNTGMPTVADNHTTQTGGLGIFTSQATGLTCGTTYYIRAYATNGVGTMYGEEYNATTLPEEVPHLITDSVFSITNNSAICRGTISFDGCTDVIVRGVCWDTLPNPTTSNNHSTNGSGTGSFTSNINGLSSNTTYFVRAYAINSAGIAYGEMVQFNTLDWNPCPNAITITDIEGNTYNTVQIGNQCWMKENLRTTKYADGTDIPQRHGYSSEISRGNWSYPNDSASYKLSYGLLYNWTAVMGRYSLSSDNSGGVRDICPSGWHVPSDAEWTQLTDYVSSQGEYRCSDYASWCAKSLAAKTGWNSDPTICAVGNIPADNNASDFSALPAGFVWSSNAYNYFGNEARFWSSTIMEYREDDMNYHKVNLIRLSYNKASIICNYSYPHQGESVRCLRDESHPSLPTVTTTEVRQITGISAICDGNVTNNGGTTIIARGVCWSTSPNPTINDSHTSDGNASGVFTSSLTELTDNTTYYVRAYVTNSIGTNYGNEESFTTPYYDGHPCPNTPTITDRDGNVYNTVKIGNQCWMKENLRTTKYADGISISQGSSISSTNVGYWYYPNNNSSNKTTYGLLYNWKAVMRDASSSSNNPSEVQGICPTGWHVPSDAEWTQLTDHVSSQDEYVCGSDNRYIAKALSSTTNWNSSTESCTVGNTPSNNNATGFSALPAGNYTSTNTYNYFRTSGHFWTSTENSSISAYKRYWSYIGSGVTRTSSEKSDGSSVRCVKDQQ